MVLPYALWGLIAVAGQTLAKSHTLFERGHDIEHRLRRDADLVATLTRRQDSNPADTAPQISTTPASGDASMIDFAKWEEETRPACDNAMAALNGQASNPTGLGVCYNLPFLDNQTGVFLAELRLYNLTAPIDPWTGIRAVDINMALAYTGATVQMTDMNGTIRKRNEITWRSVRATDDGSVLVERQNSGGNAPEMLKVLMFVGEINSNLMGTAMTQATLQPHLIPRIELTARSPTGQDVSTALNSDGASFVNGVFAKDGGPPTTIDAATAASASAAAASATPFVLPGTSLAFFPIGLVITSVWTAVFFLAVGLGTVGRMQFREQYRRRMKRELAAGVRTI